MKITRTAKKDVGCKEHVRYTATINGEEYVDYNIFRKLYGITREAGKGVITEGKVINICTTIGMDCKIFKWQVITPGCSAADLQAELQRRVDDIKAWRNTLSYTITTEVNINV